MYRSLFLALVSMMIFANVRSQAFKTPAVNLSVQAGYLAIDPSYSSYYPEVSGEFISGEAGFFIGVNYNLRLNRDISLVPEISFMSTKESVHYRAAGLVEYRIPTTGFYGLVGPQVNILSGNSISIYDRAGFELSGGIGYDISRSFYLEGRYSHEFTDRLKPQVPFDKEDHYRFRSYSIGLGFRF
ncbi:outer membrane beta-barrel protein [Salegentibacter sp. F14]